MTDANLPDDTVEKIRNHRDDLQAVAESDLPVNWVADALLTIADADGGDGPA
jgi:hypothetical protein